MSRVFVLGAGASACYEGGLWEDKPPLQSTFWESVFNPSTANPITVRRGALYNYLYEADLYDDKGKPKLNVEELMTKVHEDTLRGFASPEGARHILAPGKILPVTTHTVAKLYQELVLCFAQTINNVSVGKPCRHYAGLVRALRPDDTVLTFNWDTILDRVLWESGRWHPDDGYGVTFGYVLDEAWQRTPRHVPASEHQILKLHGSTNWLIPYVSFDLRNGIRRAMFRPGTQHVPVCYFRCTHDLPSYHELYAPGGPFCYDFPPNHPELPENGWLYPMIVPPSRVKYYEDLPDLLPILWKTAADRMRQADEVIIIGYSFPATDEMSWELMEEATRWGRIRVILVDPYPDAVAQRLKARLGRAITLDIKSIGFAEYVRRLSPRPKPKGRKARVNIKKRRPVRRKQTRSRTKLPRPRQSG
jgi:hypothetical protein